MFALLGRRPGHPSRGRRASASLVVSGCVLFVACVAGQLWWVKVVVFDGSEGGDIVRFGSSGVVAALLGWAAFASTYPRAALRPYVPLLVVIGVPFVIGGIVDGIEALGRLGEDHGDDFRPTAEFQVHDWVSFEPSLLGAAAVVFSGVPALLGLLARAAVVSAPETGRLLAAAMLAPMLSLVLVYLVEGAQVAALVTVVSGGWLVWALRQARTVPRIRAA